MYGLGLKLTNMEPQSGTIVDDCPKTSTLWTFPNGIRFSNPLTLNAKPKLRSGFRVEGLGFRIRVEGLGFRCCFGDLFPE